MLICGNVEVVQDQKKVGNPWSRDVCIFARFKLNCEVMPLGSAQVRNFKLQWLVMGRSCAVPQKCGTLDRGLCVNPSLHAYTVTLLIF